ncbi:hypothetical protein [Methanosarcina mazei]|uniref:Glycosyltransferase RgtA/B/C/D-like domain-containing protein n=1 Tax=Methanosarcina mazei TaxID=2209 RepID=A0A6C0VNZ0_METMZ|nr:hypothetical protein [Methanosarcina mazei]QIB91933.1 hypothetical protein FQU78_13630 [Methanosarcina mazei]
MIKKTPLLEELDKVIAYIGIIFSIIIIIYVTVHIEKIIYLLAVVFSFISLIIWILIRKSSSLNLAPIQSYSLYLLLVSLFFIFFTLNILIIYFRPNLYERPLIYFVFTSLMVGIVGLELFLKDNKISLSLLQIVLIGLSVSWSQLFIFPGLLGVDPWWHQMFTLKILNLHHIPSGYEYSYVPMFHLFVGSTSLITGLNYKFSTILSVSFLQISFAIMLIYLLCMFLFHNPRVSLLACLSLTIANHQIYMSYWSIPNGFAILYILLTLYILLKLKNDSSLIFAIFSVFLIIPPIFTNTIASTFEAIILFIYWLGFNICSLLYSKKKSPISLSYATLYTISMLSWWTFVSGHIVTFSNFLKRGFTMETFILTPQAMLSKYYHIVPDSEQIFNSSGMFLFFAVSFIGCLYMASKTYGNHNTFNFAVLGLTPLFLGFFSIITGHGIMEDRWLYFAEIFLSVPFAVSMFLVINSIQYKFLKYPIFFISITFLSFLLIVSPVANIDNHSFSPNSSMTQSLQTSELQAVKTISTVWNGTIKTDDYYAGSQSYDYKCEPFSNELYQKNVDELKQDFVLLRREIVGRPFKLFSTVAKWDYNVESLLNNSHFSKTYNSGSVEGFLKI